MIRLFKSTETNFTHNGVHILDDIALGDTCILLDGINEVYSLEMEVSIFDNAKWRDIEVEMYLRVPTNKGEQLFRINEVLKGFSTLKIYGKHVFFDLESNFILDTNIVEKDGRSAIAQILSGMTNNMINTYKGTSDISTFNNARIVRKNVVSALIGDSDNCFLKRWGGELELDNFNFAINERIGQDRGFQIRYGKNATGYEGNVNSYGMCTRIVPVGFDGIMLKAPKWVDSPNITKYSQIYTQEIKFDNIKWRGSQNFTGEEGEGYETLEEAQAALIEACNEYFRISECDLPTFQATINFQTLQYTEEYKHLKMIERIDKGDNVHVYLSNIGVDVTSRAVRTKWNFFIKKYIEIELGEVKQNVFKQLVNLKDKIDLVTDQLGGNSWQDIINKSMDEATKLMAEGLKDSNVITMKNQIVIGDAPEIENMVNCIVMNKNGIGYSNNGYLPEKLTLAITIDGKINASCITVGELNAALVKVGTLMSANGRTSLNMETGRLEIRNNDGEVTLETDNTGNITARKLTIIRPDGVKWIDNGTVRFDFGAEGAEPPFTESPIEIFQSFWRLGGANNNAGVYKACQYYSMKHVGRYLKMTCIKGVMVEGSGGNVQIRKPDGTVLVNNYFNNLTTDNANNTVTLTVDIGAPTYGTFGFYLEIRVSSQTNATYLRKLRIWQEG